MSNHTKEKWRKARAGRLTDGEYDYAIIAEVGGREQVIAEVFGRTSVTGRPPAEANADRIVACVNACEGIADPSVVPEMLEVLKSLRDALTRYAGPETALYEIGDANQVIARAEGKP